MCEECWRRLDQFKAACRKHTASVEALKRFVGKPDYDEAHQAVIDLWKCCESARLAYDDHKSTHGAALPRVVRVSSES